MPSINDSLANLQFDPNGNLVVAEGAYESLVEMLGGALTATGTTQPWPCANLSTRVLVWNLVPANLPDVNVKLQASLDNETWFDVLVGGSPVVLVDVPDAAATITGMYDASSIKFPFLRCYITLDKNGLTSSSYIKAWGISR